MIRREDRKGFDPQVGELVRFRDWDDMVKEFGLRYGGDIDCSFIFTPQMRTLCGKEFTITNIDDHGRISGHDSGFAVSKDMIEYVVKESDEDFADENIDSEIIDCYLSEFIN